ncbi:MAG: lantibiotic dehydratase [Saprospiraceae bacterium]|nr:lantibiotic dehydratase [Saprospiraceae bacterium]
MLFPYILTRTAGLPFSRLFPLGSPDIRDEHAWQDALRAGFDTLRRLADEPVLQRSLLLASHDLLNSIRELPPAAPPGGWNKKQRKTLLAVLRYAARAATKTSPFSRLTTVACRPLDRPDDDLPFPIEKNAVTLNVGLLPMLYDGLLRVPAFYRTLSVCPGAVWRTPSGYRWLASDGDSELWREAPAQPALAALLDRVAEPVVFEVLCRDLQAMTDETSEKAADFLLDLLDAGFLQWVLPESGLSASWPGNLYQKLGFFPPDPRITAVAELLQHGRNAGRALAYQPVPEAMAALVQLGTHVRSVLDDLQVEAEPVPAESLFYEDVDAGHVAAVPPDALQRLAAALQSAWMGLGAIPLPPARARLCAAVQAGEHLTLEALCDRLRRASPQQDARLFTAPWAGPMGALLQPYQEDGRWKAVVNALFPGGGKLLARWLHLFPAQVQEALARWQQPHAFAFPFQGWSNANMQPPLMPHLVVAPGGRTQPSGPGLRVRLEELLVERRANELVLCGQPGGAPIRLVDLGLEDPRTRPFVQRLLWLIGTPYVSVSACWPVDDEPEYRGAWRFRKRVEQADLVFRRASWQATTAQVARWTDLSGFTFFQQLRGEALAAGMPDRVFYRLEREKPQFLDLDSPVLVEQLRRKLKQRPDANLTFSEMLPVPEQVGELAQEIVVEWLPTTDYR